MAPLQFCFLFLSLLSSNTVCNYAYMCTGLFNVCLPTGEIYIRDQGEEKKRLGRIMQTYHNAQDIVMFKKYLLIEWMVDGQLISVGKQESNSRKVTGSQSLPPFSGPLVCALAFRKQYCASPFRLCICFPEDGSQPLLHSTHTNADFAALGGDSQVCLPVKLMHRQQCLRHAAKQVFARLCQPRFLFSLLNDAGLCTIC